MQARAHMFSRILSLTVKPTRMHTKSIIEQASVDPFLWHSELTSCGPLAPED